MYEPWTEIKSKIFPYLGTCGYKDNGSLQKKIEKLKSKLEGNWESAQVNSDFEIDIIAAVETKIPHSSHKGCNFHFTQAIYRQVQKLWLSIPNKEAERSRLFTTYLMATPFVPE